MSIVVAPARRQRPRIETAFDGLTGRQREILIEVASHGRSNKEIAATLGLSAQSISNHLTDIYRHTRVDTGGGYRRIRLVRWAWRQPGWREIDAAARAGDG